MGTVSEYMHWAFLMDDTAMQIGLGVRPMAMTEAIISKQDKEDFELYKKNLEKKWGICIETRETEKGDLIALIFKNETISEMYSAAEAMKEKNPIMHHAFIGLLLGYSPASIHHFADRVDRQLEEERRR